MTDEINNRSVLRVGTILHGNYRIDGYLSSGGFGNTYVATNVEFDERVAIKEFFMKGVSQRDENQTTISISNRDNAQQFEEQLEKFKKEARRLRKLRNDHLINIHDLFEENGTAYYVMDYVDGENLSERLKRTGKPLTDAEVERILPQILDALKAVHQKGIWHLDLKPANIMIDREDTVKLIDFGASKQLNAQKGGATTSTAVSYTAGYAPKEQVAQFLEMFGPWTDLYSLGATLYKLMTNNNPPQYLEIEENGEDAFVFPNGVSQRMRDLVRWMMQPSRLHRPQSIEEVEARLPHTEDSSKPQETEETPKPKLTEEQSRHQQSEQTVYRASNEETIYDNSKKEVLLSNQKNEEPLKVASPTPMSKPSNYLPWIIIGAFIVFGILLGVIFNIRESKVEADVPDEFADTTLVDNAATEKKGRFFIANDVEFFMVQVEGGTFDMGSTTGENDEKPVHSVTLSRYYIGETEVTQALWEAVMGSNPSYWKGDNLPVEQVSWRDCQAFIKKLNELMGESFRLPTEAEWEFAARGGNNSEGFEYSGSKYRDEVAWYADNSGDYTHDVATKSPNELGIYDMSGNVWEWCQDWYGSYGSSAQSDPTGYSSKSYRVLRGGSWHSGANSCRVARRNIGTPTGADSHVGLRLALSR